MVRPESEEEEEPELSVVEASVSTSMLARQAALSVGASRQGGPRAAEAVPSQSSTPATRKRAATEQSGSNTSKALKGETIFHHSVWCFMLEVLSH